MTKKLNGCMGIKSGTHTSKAGRTVTIRRIPTPIYSNQRADRDTVEINYGGSARAGLTVWYPDSKKIEERVKCTLDHFLHDRDNIGQPIRILSDEEKEMRVEVMKKARAAL